jgi:hypothetical protein
MNVNNANALTTSTYCILHCKAVISYRWQKFCIVLDVQPMGLIVSLSIKAYDIRVRLILLTSFGYKECQVKLVVDSIVI